MKQLPHISDQNCPLDWLQTWWMLSLGDSPRMSSWWSSSNEFPGCHSLWSVVHFPHIYQLVIWLAYDWYLGNSNFLDPSWCTIWPLIGRAFSAHFAASPKTQTPNSTKHSPGSSAGIIKVWSRSDESKWLPNLDRALYTQFQAICSSDGFQTWTQFVMGLSWPDKCFLKLIWIHPVC